jgi:hypothetical protein
MTTDEPPKVLGETKTVQLPTIGRIVLVRVSAQVFRPAIVIEADMDGRVFAHILMANDDPKPSGLSTGQATLSYGDHIGGWVWPPRANPKLTFDV